MLVIEEVEAIDTEIPVFQKYLGITASLLSSQGTDLYIGKTLGSADYSSEVVCNELATIAVANSLAAAWFYPNTVTIWDEDEFITKNYSPSQRKDISDELAKIIESNDHKQEITWKMRRVVLKRK